MKYIDLPTNGDNPDKGNGIGVDPATQGSLTVDILAVTAALGLTFAYLLAIAMPPMPHWNATEDAWLAWGQDGLRPHLWGLAFSGSPLVLRAVNWTLQRLTGWRGTGSAIDAMARLKATKAHLVSCALMLAALLVWIPVCWPHTGLSGFWTAVGRLVAFLTAGAAMSTRWAVARPTTHAPGGPVPLAPSVRWSRSPCRGSPSALPRSAGPRASPSENGPR